MANIWHGAFVDVQIWLNGKVVCKYIIINQINCTSRIIFGPRCRFNNNMVQRNTYISMNMLLISIMEYTWKCYSVIQNGTSEIIRSESAQYINARLGYHCAHDDVIKWKHFPRYWPVVRGSHRSPVISPHKGQWRGALMFSLICAWINGWVNNRETGDLRRHRAHYDVIVMLPAPDSL